jgi:Dolichyl-phosphate-mannose-protein mannosyltransferase
MGQPRAVNVADSSARWRSPLTLDPRAWVYAGLAVVLAIALGLRLWGVKQGLPFAYNTDEETLYLPQAIHMFGHGLNPHYFENPPAFTYALHVLLTVLLGSDATRTFSSDPTSVYVIARCFVAVIGTATVWLVYATGARLFRREVGLLAAAIMAVAFLPVFYAHLALNDVPTLLPLTLALFGAAGVARKGRLIDYATAGVGVGLACATKYTGGVIVVSVLAAGFLHLREYSDRRMVLGRLAVASALALLAFVVSNPYSVLTFNQFWAGLSHQSTLSSEAQGKLGAPRTGGFVYYMWTLTWGFGWLPSVAVVGATLTIWRNNKTAGLLLVPTAALFVVFMGLETRYFGRWMLPIFPILCLLAAYFGFELAARIGKLFGAWHVRIGRALAIGTVTFGLCAQGLFYSIHVDNVLSRPFTAEKARRWMVAHVPVGSRVVIEPVVPNAWLEYLPGSPERAAGKRIRWHKLPALHRLDVTDTGIAPRSGPQLSIEDYERTLSPALIPYYERYRYCWVLTGSTQSGRAFADPRAVPGAVAYYHALASEGAVVYHVTPYGRGRRPIPFNFDWSFDYYPLAYVTPGPEITIYRLTGGDCRSPISRG